MPSNKLWQPGSIRWRLQAWHGSLLALVLLALGVVSHQTAKLDELERIERDLADQIGLVLESADDSPERSFRPDIDAIREKIGLNIQRLDQRRLPSRQHDYYIFFDRDGTIFSASRNVPAAIPFPVDDAEPTRPRATLIPGQATATWTTRTRGDLREVYRILPLGDAILIGRPIDARALWSRLAWLALAGFGLLAAGLLGGWWLTGRALAPITKISQTAVALASGDLSRRVAVTAGRTELDQLAAVLNQTFDQLQRSFDRQARFSSDASHELRTPLSVMLSKIQLTLARPREPREYEEALRVCLRATQRMRALTESLLALSRLDSGQEPLHAEPVDLAEITAETAAFLADRFSARHLVLTQDLQPAPLIADRLRLSQVVTNLLANAAEHTPERGTVTLETRRLNATVELIVANSGPGIAAEHLPHLFDRFYRVDPSRTGSGGSGLGLSITQAIVAAHGGHIGVECPPGQGVRFWVRIPVE